MADSTASSRACSVPASPGSRQLLRYGPRVTTLLDAIGRTPLVALQRIGRDLPCRVLVKCEHLNPGGSVKDRLAKAIVDDAEARGALAPGGTIVEATAGNTGMGLALVAAVRGYSLVCVLPEKMSVDKRIALEALGARVVITPNVAPGHADNFQEVAKRLAHDNGWFLADQFRNPANARVHLETTGPELLAQVAAEGGKIGAFVAGAGTGGTITGVGRFLAEVAPRARIVLADPIGSALGDIVEHGEVRENGAYLVEGIGASKHFEVFDPRVVHLVERVSDDESFAMARRLQREEGLLVGGSAGTAVVAALRIAARPEIDGAVVAVLPDAWDRYRSQPWMQA
jgi:cysteine synthase